MTTSTQISWIDATWLYKNLSSAITIIDTQPDIHDYILGHIPGAVYLNENHFRLFSHQLPSHYAPPQSIRQILQYCNLNNSQPAVIYSSKGSFSKSGDGLEQTMVAYSLARYGHKQIFILNGGLQSWIDNGYKTTKLYPIVPESDFLPEINNDLFIPYNQFKEVYNSKDITLIDVRPRLLYQNGHFWAKSGHIPGAINFPWRLLMENDNPFKLRPDSKLMEIITARKIRPDKPLIIYCGTGREASAAFVYFKFHLNFLNVKLFEGSFTEWCTDPNNPTVTGPGPY